MTRPTLGRSLLAYIGPGRNTLLEAIETNKFHGEVSNIGESLQKTPYIMYTTKISICAKAMPL
jgi:hypothetical protein